MGGEIDLFSLAVRDDSNPATQYTLPFPTYYGGMEREGGTLLNFFVVLLPSNVVSIQCRRIETSAPPKTFKLSFFCSRRAYKGAREGEGEGTNTPAND
jgi:hypothetical protein